MRQACTGALVHYVQTVRGRVAGPGRRMRRMCAGTPFHYEPTVRERATSGRARDREGGCGESVRVPVHYEQTVRPCPWLAMMTAAAPVSATRQGLPGTARHVTGCRLTQETRVLMRVNDVAGNGPAIYCSPRHRMPLNSAENKSAKCVWSMTWRATGLADIAHHGKGCR